MEEWGRSIEVNDDEHCLFLALRIGYFYVYSVEQNAWIHFSEYTRSLRQARHQDLAAGGVKNQKGGSHFKNTVMDTCSNRWAKREMGGTDFKWGGRAPLDPPLATALHWGSLLNNFVMGLWSDNFTAAFFVCFVTVFVPDSAVAAQLCLPSKRLQGPPNGDF